MSSLFSSSEPKQRSYADRARDGLAALGQKASDAQFEAEGLLGLRPKTAEEQLYEACCPALSYQTRLIGFCLCMFASFILALFASFMLRRLLWRGDAEATRPIHYLCARVGADAFFRVRDASAG